MTAVNGAVLLLVATWFVAMTLLAITEQPADPETDAEAADPGDYRQENR